MPSIDVYGRMHRVRKVWQRTFINILHMGVLCSDDCAQPLVFENMMDICSFGTYVNGPLRLSWLVAFFQKKDRNRRVHICECQVDEP